MSGSILGINLHSLCLSYDDTDAKDDFSLCFEDSVLSWTICGISLVIGLIYMVMASTSQYTYRWLRPGFIVSVVGALCSTIPQFMIIVIAMKDTVNEPVLKWNGAILIICTLFNLCLMCYERTKGNTSTLPVWTYWALLTLYGIIKIRTLILRSWQDTLELDSALPLIFCVYAALCLVNLIIHSIEEIPDELLNSKTGSTTEIAEHRSPAPEDSVPQKKKDIELEDEESKMKYDRPEYDKRKPCPAEYVSFFKFITFHWLNKIVWKGFKRPLVDADLYNVPVDSQTQSIVNDFYTAWTGGKPCPNGTTRCQRRGKLILSLMKFNWKSIIAAIIFKLLNDFLTFVPPLILKQIIYYNGVKSSDTDAISVSYGVTYCVLLILSLLFQTILIQAYFDRTINTGMKIRVALVGAIYRKALLLSNAGQKASQLGQMINLMQVDAQKFQEIFTYINMLWSAPLQITLAMYLLYGELGPSTFVGLSVTIFMLPFNSILMGKVQAFQRQVMKITDLRVRKTNEVLDGIKVIKLYGWEDSFTDDVEMLRKRELTAMKNMSHFSVIITFIWSCSPILVALFTFLCYSLLGNQLTSGRAFVSLALFNILRFPLVMLPNMINQLIQARVSINRIKEFFSLPELEEDAVIRGDNSNPFALEIRDGEFSWDRENSSESILQGIDIKIERGKLVAIVGAVGSGKSSTISAMLGEMEKIQGEVLLNGSVSYVPQVAWILNDTVKSNILFGAPWDRSWYKSVIAKCALEEDLLILPNGDTTEIGEKGINLSGGQKQRVSLARAVYNKNDIYIFDDPLSAVDAHVGKHIFENVIGPKGIINDKTRILVTHKLSVLPEVDHVIVLKDGKVLEQGTYKELMSQNSELQRLVSSYEPDKDEAESEEDEEDVKSEQGDKEGNMLRRRSRLSTKNSRSSIKKDKKEKEEKLIEEEKVEKGNIKARVYLDYLKYMGSFLSTVTIFSFFMQHGSNFGTSLWLAEWANANDGLGEDEQSDTFLYLGVYSILALVQTVFVMVFVLCLVYASIKAASQMHRRMFERILRVPMSFFDTTPLGRILNRFSKDINTIDVQLPQSMRSFANVLGTVFTTLILIGTTIPIMFAVFVPIGVLYIGVQRIFVPTSRQLKRLESVSRSPIYNQFGESLLGIASIRGYGKCKEFIGYNMGLTDDNVRSYYLSMMSNRWLSLRLEITGHIVIFLTALTSVLQARTLDAAHAGLAISAAMGVTQALAWVVRMYSELEVNVVSVERVNEYSALTTESELQSDNTPKESWPQKGVVEYKNVSVRYREGLDLVLKNLDFTIKAGEKIGIVGRTGAGKSSITLTLFRILELAEGSITIDGTNIADIGLHELRKKISIIPQDPVLFSDTIRKNLDPFNMHDDKQIWLALESASLKTYFEQQEDKLDFLVQEGGTNLSVGQRQLLCLARALISENKIIVLDEATAAVDIETDYVIQDAIRKTFADRTILTIAHRLNTVLDYDRILVLDKGEIAEFGNSLELKEKQGIFHGMLSDAGLLQSVRNGATKVNEVATQASNLEDVSSEVSSEVAANVSSEVVANGGVDV